MSKPTDFLQVDIQERREAKHRRRNFSLLAGSILVGLILFAALLGPQLAPHDPIEENIIIQLPDGWVIPPFPLFTPGFLLGSDMFGRDLLSRLLWAIRPTLVMVSLVAAVRLVLGTMFGLIAGWSNERIGKTFDNLISGALAIPVLMVALIVIAAIGADYGIWAFIAGMAITGWAETAQTVREQTRIVKGELYVEAARALGASNTFILLLHVLRQIMPMFWMLLALEVSNTLMITAGLGFLGYYIGGDVWIEVGDFVARRVSGMPELGQMLATSQTSLDQPLPMVVIGTVIFIIVLGFNLLGEGLRKQLSVERLGKRTAYGFFTQVIYPWFEEQIWIPARQHPLRTTTIGMVCVGTLGGFLWWRVQSNPSAGGILDAVPGGHLWANEYHDPWGTQAIPEVGPALTPTLTILYENPAGLTGGPAIAADGTLYVGAADPALYALAPDGAVLWHTTLFTEPVGTPAIAADGTLYVSDRTGGLTALSPAGQTLWRYQPEQTAIPANGPTAAPDGTLYYAFGSKIQAVSASGEPLWRAQTPYNYRGSPPRLSPNGEWLFWEDLIFDPADGSRVDYPLISGADAYFSGGDARTYMLSGPIVMQWARSGNEAVVNLSANWDSQVFRFHSPVGAGVLPDQTIWIFYSSQFGGTNAVWMDLQGRLSGSAIAPRVGRSNMVGIDADKIIYACGPDNVSLTCYALEPSHEGTVWTLSLPESQIYRGGAIIADRLYVVTHEGYLYLISN